MKDTFIETRNVIGFKDVCIELDSPDSRIGPSIAMITSSAGRGKTEASKRYAANSNAIYIPPLNIISPGALLREITFELCKIKPYRIENCLEAIGDEMNKLRRLVIIDEADLLETRILELLRNVNERYSCPILLIGEDGLKSKVASKRRLSSRIRRRMEFAPIGQPDIALFFKKAIGIDITSKPAITTLIHKHCGGDWRPVLVIALKAERATKDSGLDDISVKMIEDIVKNEDNKDRS